MTSAPLERTSLAFSCSPTLATTRTSFDDLAYGQDDQHRGVVATDADDHCACPLDTCHLEQLLARRVAVQADESGRGGALQHVGVLVDHGDPLAGPASLQQLRGCDRAAVSEPQTIT